MSPGASHTPSSAMQGGLRRRAAGASRSSDDFLPRHEGDERGHASYVLPTPALHFLGFTAALGAAFFLVVLVPQQLPEPLRLQDEPSHPGRFIAERAMLNLRNLTRMGPRVSGSYESEVLAIGVLRDEIASITAAAKPAHRVELDLQRVSGTFPLRFLDGITHVYGDLANVVVRVSPSTGSSGHSILMNCHFDSVPDSPGATDDASSCVIMLEIFRILTQSDEPLRHNLVLLFNGAEENFMQASHGFITKHKWAKEVRAVLNLESCGAGGKEMLFQSGPNHPWLLKLYSKNVKYPSGSAVADEIFQSGLFPGDTDYRIFRDFGGIPGLDFAWYLNGYVYHTEHDSLANVPMGTLQRTGDNMLALASALLSADEVLDTDKHKEGSMVFFDVLGFFIVLWSLFAADILHIITIALSLYSIRCNIREAKGRGLPKRTYVRQLLQCTGVVFLSWLVSILVAVCIAFGLTAVNKTMSWFSHPLWIVFLYVFPVITSSMSVLLWKSRQQQKIVVSPWTLFQLYYDAYQAIWTALLLLTTVCRLQSGFIPFLAVIFPTVGNLVRLKLFRHWRDGKWLLLHGAVMIFPFVQCSYLTLYGLQFFIPLTGRLGGSINSEVVLAVICAFLVNFLSTLIAPVILLVRHPQRVVSLFVGVFVTALAVLIFTPLGFPYSTDPSAIVPQRFATLHVRRSFHDIHGSRFKHETGFWVVHLDMNSERLLKDAVPEIARARTTEEDCANHFYCGMPYYIPMWSFVWKNQWLDGPDVNIPTETYLRLVSNSSEPGGPGGSTRRYLFNLTGPDHMEVMVSPVAEVQLLRWSFTGEPPLAGPKWNGRETYFIYIAYADSPRTWDFSMDFKVPEGWRGPVFEIAVGSHFLHGPHQRSKALTHLFNKYPKWGTSTGWQATLQSFIY